MQKSPEEWTIIREIWRCLDGEPKVAFVGSLLLLALMGGVMARVIYRVFDRVANPRIYLIETPSQRFLNHHADRTFKCQGKTYVLSEYSYQEIDPEKIPENAIDCRGD